MNSVFLKIAEYTFTLSFPLLVFIVAFTLYPIDYDETTLLTDSRDLQSSSYISTLVAASGYSGWHVGYGVVEDVEVREGRPMYMLRVRTGEGVIKVIAFKLDVKDFDLRALKGSEITFYGPQLEIRGVKVVLARIIVTGAPNTHGMHHVMCICKGEFKEGCSEIMKKHVEIMKKQGRINRS